jgi:hypothetical protein
MPADKSSDVINMQAFMLMCMKMRINSKRQGHTPLIPIKTQRYLIEKIIEGINAGIHQFVVLKCRQSGTTTIVLAFLIYWLMRHRGLTGLFAIDDNDKKTFCNLVFRDMVHSLISEGEEWAQPMTSERRELVGFKNGSKIAFDNANKRQKGTLGRSIGINLFHGSEVGFWSDEDGLLSLMASFDNRNPNRLYIFESTACGFNLFQKMCSKAETATASKFIFIPWVLHDWYEIKRDDELGRFQMYWDGQVTPEEDVWVQELKTRYNIETRPEHIAWWRYMLKEEFYDNLPALYQEYPPLPEYAFQYGGSTFFDPSALQQATVTITSPTNTHKARYFRFKFGKNFTETTCEECENREGFYHLAIWDAPRSGEGVIYSLGVDPAYGMTDTSDYACIQMLRCYEDGVEQVAEFAARGLSSMHLAWAVLYLFGAYHLTEGVPNVVWNCEIQGGGASVINTVEQIQQDIGGFYDKLGTHFDGLRAYAYKRCDSLTPNYSAKHWSTNAVNRDQFLHHIKSYFESGFLVVRSLHLIQEMSRMIRGPGGYIESSSGTHDDLVMGMGIAIMNYWDPIRFDLEGSGHTIGKALREREMLLRGTWNEDLISMRISGWMKNKRDAFKDREEELREMLETESGN